MVSDKLKMDQRLVREWLTEYKSLPGSGMPAFARQISSNVDLLKALFHVLNSSSSTYLDSVSSQLYEFYRSGHLELKRFCIQFVPVLIWQYLRAVAFRENSGRIESLLLGIYNLEVVEADGTPKAESFTIPTIARPSIYHEPMSPLALTDTLHLSHQNDHTVLTRGPLPQISTLNGQNRFDVLCHVLSQYNADISYISSMSLQSMCAVYSRLALTGFNVSPAEPTHPASGQSSKVTDLHLNLHNHPRIPLTPAFMLEMMNGVYFAMFNGHATVATQALEDIHFRASYQMFAEVLLVTNAIKNSLETNPSGRPSDGPVGINIAVTPASPVVKRAAITNSSFKNRRNKDSATTTTTITVTIDSVDKSLRQGRHNTEKMVVRKTNSDHLSKDTLLYNAQRRAKDSRMNGTSMDSGGLPQLTKQGSRSLEALELRNMTDRTMSSHGMPRNGGDDDDFPSSDSLSARTSPSEMPSYERSRSKDNIHGSAENLRVGDFTHGGKVELTDVSVHQVMYRGINGSRNTNSNRNSGASINSSSYETTL